ncbi:MAG TPA: hypothetical protein VGM07_10265 [Stellaceae bacterium]|jgi:hypothetical protein
MLLWVVSQLSSYPGRGPFARAALMLLLAVASGCTAVPPPQAQNRLIGTWADPDNDTITIRQDTVVQNQRDGRSIALGSGACDGAFSFAYATWSRSVLTGLLPRQPGLDKNLSDMLVAPTYPVAVLHCGQGDQTYVLLNDRQLVAIYRDGDVGAIERLARR